MGVRNAEGMRLAYLQAVISGVFWGVLNFKNRYFLLLSNRCCIFKCFMFSTVIFCIITYLSFLKRG